jgi:hypothetical protein
MDEEKDDTVPRTRYSHVHRRRLWERLSGHRGTAELSVKPSQHGSYASYRRPRIGVARGTVVTGTLAAEDQVVLSFKVNGRAQ